MQSLCLQLNLVISELTVSLENGTAAILFTDFSGSWHSAMSTAEDLFIYQLLFVLL